MTTTPTDAERREQLRQELIKLLDGHTEWSRDTSLSGEYLVGLIWPSISKALASPSSPDGASVEMPLSDVNDLDDVVQELGIEDSATTPTEAVRDLKAELEILRASRDRPSEGRSPEEIAARAQRVVIDWLDACNPGTLPEFRLEQSFILQDLIADAIREAISPPSPEPVDTSISGADEELERLLNSDDGTPIEILPDGSVREISPAEDAAAWAVLQALHEDVPHERRPKAWSDLNSRQEKKIRSAARAVMAVLQGGVGTLGLSPSSDRERAIPEIFTVDDLWEIDCALSDAISDGEGRAMAPHVIKHLEKYGFQIRRKP